MTYEYDAAIAMTPLGDGRYAGALDPGWTVGPQPNGGTVLGCAVSAAIAETGRPCAAASISFCGLPRVGALSASVTVVRAGARFTTAGVTLVQSDRPIAVCTITCGAASGDVDWLVATPPDIKGPDDCRRLPAELYPGFPVDLMHRLDLRLTAETATLLDGRPSGEALLEGWIRFADGRPNDAVGLLQLLDSTPPACLNIGVVGWSPTLQFSGYVRGEAGPGWLRIRVWSDHVGAGTLDERAALWDDRGLVAQSSQLGLLP